MSVRSNIILADIEVAVMPVFNRGGVMKALPMIFGLVISLYVFSTITGTIVQEINDTYAVEENDTYAVEEIVWEDVQRYEQPIPQPQETETTTERNWTKQLEEETKTNIDDLSFLD